MRVVHNTIYWGGYHHQSAEDVELCQADVVDVAAARSALLDPLEHQVRVVVAEAFKPGFGPKDDLIYTTWRFLAGGSRSKIYFY